MAELDKNKDKLQTPATEERVAKAFDWLMVLQETSETLENELSAKQYAANDILPTDGNPAAVIRAKYEVSNAGNSDVISSNILTKPTVLSVSQGLPLNTVDGATITAANVNEKVTQPFNIPEWEGSRTSPEETLRTCNNVGSETGKATTITAMVMMQMV